jgi:polyhydroxybutyrate depolymerase
MFWAARNGCDPQNIDYKLLPATQNQATTAVFHYTFNDCFGGATVEYYVIEGGGHNIPGVPYRLTAEIAGEVNLDIHGATVMWDFFAQHALDSAE